LSAPTIWEHVLAALVGLVLPISGAIQHLGRRGSEPETFEPAQKISMYWINGGVLLVLGAAAVAAWRHAGRSFAELGLAAPEGRLALGAGLAVLVIAAHALDTWSKTSSPERLAETRARWRRESAFMPATPRELRHSCVLLLGASVGEEIVWRGFLIGYLLHFTGTTAAGTAAAVALPALVFGLSHLWQGPAAVVKIVFFAACMGAILLATGSLWIPMAVHFTVDLVGMLMGPKLLAEGVEAERA